MTKMNESVAVENDVISQMAKFNFENPITVTVFYDEEYNKKIKKRNVSAPCLSSKKQKTATREKHDEKRLKSPYNDLYKWTKDAMKKQVNVNKNISCQTQTEPRLCSQSYVTRPNVSNCNDKNFIKNTKPQNPNTCKIFSGGPPGNEITINVDTRYLKNRNTNNVSVQHRTTSPRKIQYLKKTICIQSNNTSNIHPRQPEKKSPLGSCLNKTSCQQSSNYKNVNINGLPNNDNVTNFQVMQTMKNTNNEPDILRHSISTDSGFISPETFNIPSDTMNSRTCQQDYQSNDLTSPLVPNIFYNVISAPALCFVCGKSTNMVCLGCSKYYYCSIICQSAHWGEHRWICHLIPKNS